MRRRRVDLKAILADEDLRRLYQFRFKGWGLLQFEVEQLDGLVMDRVELRELLYPRT